MNAFSSPAGATNWLSGKSTIRNDDEGKEEAETKHIKARERVSEIERKRKRERERERERERWRMQKEGSRPAGRAPRHGMRNILIFYKNM
jgi:hypothetical protein